MMKPFFYWSKNHKAIGISLDSKGQKQILIELTKGVNYWGHLYEEDFNCHSLGFYFFQLCYYA